MFGVTLHSVSCDKGVWSRGVAGSQQDRPQWSSPVVLPWGSSLVVLPGGPPPRSSPAVPPGGPPPRSSPTVLPSGPPAVCLPQLLTRLRLRSFNLWSPCLHIKQSQPSEPLKGNVQLSPNSYLQDKLLTVFESYWTKQGTWKVVFFFFFNQGDLVIAFMSHKLLFIYLFFYQNCVNVVRKVVGLSSGYEHYQHISHTLAVFFPYRVCDSHWVQMKW